MQNNIRRAVETFCLSCAVFTSILIGFKFSYTTDITERRVMVFCVVGLALVSTIYLAVRLRLEARKAASGHLVDDTHR